MITKICTKCKIEKEVNEFGIEKRRKDGLRSECKECKKDANKQYRNKYKERIKIQSRQYQITHKKQIARKERERVYGITSDELNRIFITQARRCGICKSVNPKSKRGWNVDHDHKTNQVRGILCQPCNTGLGYFKDNKEGLLLAIQYLNNAVLPAHLLS